MFQEITDKKIWNDFLLSLQPNTFLHAWEWGQVQQATGEAVRYLGWFSDANELQGAALVITVNARRGRHYLIPHGPVVSPSASWRMKGGRGGSDAHFPAFLTELITHLRAIAKQDRVISLRIAPLLENNPENAQLFKTLGFRPAPLHVHAELTWIVDMSKPDNELLGGMRKTTRHAIRKAEQAGVATEIITDPAAALSRFWPLYQETHSRHGFVLWPKNMIAAQLEHFSPANIFTVVARHNNQDVAAAIIPLFGTTAFYYHGASKKMPSAVPAAQLVQFSAMQEAKRRGLVRYNFWGIAPENQPQHPFAGITTFKKGFGGHAIDYLHAQDLPLSPAYWKLWAIEMCRKYRRGF